MFTRLLNIKLFRIIPLGTSSTCDYNLTAFLLSSISDNNFVCLDAGSLLLGIKKYVDNIKTIKTINSAPVQSSNYFNLKNQTLIRSKSLSDLKNKETDIIRFNIRSYVLSHAHLDHIAGLVINSQLDCNNKFIFGTHETINNIKDHIFNWKIFPNFGNEGEGIKLNKYIYSYIDYECKYVDIPNTQFKVKSYKLCHDCSNSTAFIFKYNTHHIIYFGDTGSDSAEKTNCLDIIWNKVTKYIIDNTINGMLIEISFSTFGNKNNLFGHMNIDEFINELTCLSNKIINLGKQNNPLDKLNIIITHIKQNENDETEKEIIKNHLQKYEQIFGCHFIFPEQGREIIV